jgi:hypothetical protein
MPYAISVSPTGMDARRSEKTFGSLSTRASPRITMDSPLLKVFHGKVGMKFDDPSLKPVRPTMTHFFYIDEKARTKVKHWIGAVGPTGF